MKKPLETVQRGVVSSDHMDEAIRRANARMRHFRGVAASVMSEAQNLWQEIWDAVADPRTCEEILNGEDAPSPPWPEPTRRLLTDKLHLLGIHIDYARRLCEGSIGNESHEKGDPGPWQGSSR